MIPSIFNDVIGPVMRGPSSSHCAASVRIGRLARDLMDGAIDSVLVEFDPNGSLATTHDGQGSDMGLFGGLLGWDAQDERLVRSAEALREAGIDIDIRIRPIGATHPNTYRLTLRHRDCEHILVANSTGGGMIEVVAIDDIPLRIHGDTHETLLLIGGADPDPLLAALRQLDVDAVELRGLGPPGIIQLQSQVPVADDALPPGIPVRRLRPVLPVPSRPGMEVPFLSAGAMLEVPGAGDRSLASLASEYEQARGGFPESEVTDRMLEIVRLLRASIMEGIAGTEFADRILGAQSGGFRDRLAEGRLFDGGVLNRMTLYVTALMEVKSSMGVIVAAPTAGSCGTLPGVVLAATEDDGAAARAMLAAGLVGIFVAAGSSFAAEVGGCQAETGAGAAMAAAALVTLADGPASQALAAASMALQNVLGLVCDPVANRVEVPCLGRNVAGAANALVSANMALAGFAEVIPLDQVIAAHRDISAGMPAELRCTCGGGLSTTPAALAIERDLKQRGCASCKSSSPAVSSP